MQAPLGERSRARPEGKNGRPTGGFFSLPACTDAESLEQTRAVVHVFFARGFQEVLLRHQELRCGSYPRGSLEHDCALTMSENKICCS